MSLAMTLLPTRRRPVAARAAGLAGRQRWWLVTVLLSVGAADQVTKAWAWRNLPMAHINSGAGLLFGPAFTDWWRDGARGLVVDLVGTALLLATAAVLVRRHRRTLNFLAIALILSGWASNLADRLALHTLTAPGSARGVVDFLRWDGRLWNVADLAIIAGVLLGIAAWFLDGVRPQPLPVLAPPEAEPAYADAAVAAAAAFPPPAQRGLPGRPGSAASLRVP
jgi:lipoprotein signal peptidase